MFTYCRLLFIHTRAKTWTVTLIQVKVLLVHVDTTEVRPLSRRRSWVVIPQIAAFCQYVSPVMHPTGALHDSILITVFVCGLHVCTSYHEHKQTRAAVSFIGCTL